MAKKEDWERKTATDDMQHSQQLEKQLAELQKAQEETIRLKNVEKFVSNGRMARTIAHEIRNPLTNISLALEQLQDELPQSDDVQLLIDMINRNTMRINQMITDLINSTKFAQLNFTSASVNNILHDIVNGSQQFARQKNAVIEEHYAEHLPPLLIDMEKMTTAFENLITNAIESVHANDGLVKVTTVNQNNKCVITVENNGESVSGEKIERLFEPYFTNKKGSGLSLTEAQNIILNHGGNIYVESEPGKGTTFTIILEFA